MDWIHLIFSYVGIFLSLRFADDVADVVDANVHSFHFTNAFLLTVCRTFVFFIIYHLTNSLTLQVTNLVFPNGQPFPVTTLYNATEAESGWQEIASHNGVTIPSGEMKVGRKKTRRINMSLISNRTKRKICQILALDYCCLNIALPEVCSSAGYDDKDADEEDDGDEAVYCAMEKQDDETMEHALTPLVIYPWKDP